MTFKGCGSSLWSLGLLLRFSFIFKQSVKAVKQLMEHSLEKFWPFLNPLSINLITLYGSTMQVAYVFLSASSSEERIT